MSDLIEGYLGKTEEGRKSRLPAKLDFMQSFTGGFLALFMWAHMLLVSSILISKDFMYTVTKLLEGSFIFEGGNPLLVTIAAAVIFAIKGRRFSESDELLPHLKFVHGKLDPLEPDQLYRIRSVGEYSRETLFTLFAHTAHCHNRSLYLNEGGGRLYFPNLIKTASVYIPIWKIVEHILVRGHLYLTLQKSRLFRAYSRKVCHLL